MNNKRKESVFLIYGEDEFQVSSKARELIHHAIPMEEQALGLEVIDGQVETVAKALERIQQCLEAIQTIGFLGGRKAVWLQNATFLDQGNIGKSPDVRARLQDLANVIKTGLPEAHLLVITSPRIDEKSDFFKTCQTKGTIIRFDVPKPWQRDKPAERFAATAFQKLGLTASGDVIATFVQKVGTDSRQLQQEADKLSIYLGESRNVCPDDLEAIVSSSRELFVWNLEEAVGDRDLGRSLNILRQLLFQKAKAIGLIMSLENRFRSLLIFREALDNDWFRLIPRGEKSAEIMKGTITPEQDQCLSQALSADHRLKNPYVAGIRAKQAQAFSRQELDRCLQMMVAAHQQLVSSNLPEALLLETLIIKICRTQEPPTPKATKARPGKIGE